MSNASLNLVISSEYVWESFLLNLLESAASFTQHHWPHCTVCDLVTCELPQIHILIYYESYGSSVSGGWGEQLFLFYDDSDSFLFFSTTFSFSLQRLLEFLPDNSPSVSCSVMSESLWSHGLQPSGSSAHEIPQARILKWIGIPFFRGSSDPGIKPQPPALQADSLPYEPPGKPLFSKGLS